LLKKKVTEEENVLALYKKIYEKIESFVKYAGNNRVPEKRLQMIEIVFCIIMDSTDIIVNSYFFSKEGVIKEHEDALFANELFSDITNNDISDAFKKWVQDYFNYIQYCIFGNADERFYRGTFLKSSGTLGVKFDDKYRKKYKNEYNE
jgi:hypothetical protein